MCDAGTAGEVAVGVLAIGFSGCERTGVGWVAGIACWKVGTSCVHCVSFICFLGACGITGSVVVIAVSSTGSVAPLGSSTFWGCMGSGMGSVDLGILTHC